MATFFRVDGDISPPRLFKGGPNGLDDISNESCYFSMNGDAPNGEENETDFKNCCRPKRSSSLKSKNSPVTQRGEKKIVRFADTLGLDVVKILFDNSAPPTIPASALKDLDLNDAEAWEDLLSEPYIMQRVYEPCFPQPGANNNFIRRVKDYTVCLEHLTVNEDRRVTGLIRVKNLAYTKEVNVHVTFNNWGTKSILSCTYHCSSPAENTDCFQFQFWTPQASEKLLGFDENVEFVIEYKVDNNQVFWDNNFGKNYVLVAVEKMSSQEHNNTNLA